MIKGVLALLLLGLTLVRWFYAWFGLRLSYGGLVGYSKRTTKGTCKKPAGTPSKNQNKATK